MAQVHGSSSCYAVLVRLVIFLTTIAGLYKSGTVLIGLLQRNSGGPRRQTPLLHSDRTVENAPVGYAVPWFYRSFHFSVDYSLRC